MRSIDPLFSHRPFLDLALTFQSLSVDTGNSRYLVTVHVDVNS